MGSANFCWIAESIHQLCNWFSCEKSKYVITDDWCKYYLTTFGNPPVFLWPFEYKKAVGISLILIFCRFCADLVYKNRFPTFFKGSYASNFFSFIAKRTPNSIANVPMIFFLRLFIIYRKLKQKFIIEWYGVILTTLFSWINLCKFMKKIVYIALKTLDNIVCQLHNM